MKRILLLLLIGGLILISCGPSDEEKRQIQFEKEKKLLEEKGYSLTIKDFKEVYDSYLAKKVEFSTLKLFLDNDKDSTFIKIATNEIGNNFYTSPVSLSRYEIVDYFFQKNLIKPSFKDTLTGKNLLYVAIDSYGQEKTLDGLKMIKFLLEKGCNINNVTNKGLTPLVRAIEDNNTDIVSLLLDKGAKQNYTAKIGKINGTPLLLAISNKNIDIIKLLIKFGADVNDIDHKGRSNFMNAFIRYPDIGFDTFNLMLKNGANINKKDFQTNSPLTLAIMENDKKLVKYLIDNGANPNTIGKVNGNKCPVLIVAAANSSSNILEILLNAGANKKVKVMGHDAQYYAKSYNKSENVKLLNNSNSLVKSCVTKTKIHFEKSLSSCISNSSLSITGLDNNNHIEIDSVYNTVIIDGDCIKGRYNFIWSFTTNCLTDPKSINNKYSGTFYLNGNQNNYTIVVYDRSGSTVGDEVYPY